MPLKSVFKIHVKCIWYFLMNAVLQNHTKIILFNFAEPQSDLTEVNILFLF